MSKRIKLQEYNNEDKLSLFNNNYDVMWLAISKANDVGGLVFTFYDEQGTFTMCIEDYLDIESPVMCSQDDYTFVEYIVDLNQYK